jgi:GAF domain-containing protein
MSAAGGERMIPTKPANETQRLEALRGYEILDTEPEAAFDDLTFLASYVCQTPVALISLIDADRQWFKSKVGVSAVETSRDIAFCASAILQTDVFIVPDASQDARFADNPLVVADPKIRFYAGAPLITEGKALGTLCVVDRVARELRPEQLEALRALSRQVMAQLDLRRNLKRLKSSLKSRDKVEAEKERSLRELQDALGKIRTLEGLLPVCLSCKKIQDQKGDWQPFEYYVRKHSEAKVAHRICPECARAISA